MELKHVAQQDGRLSTILREEMAFSTGLMNRLKWDEKLLVNGVPQRTNYPVRAGDLVSAILDEPEPDYPAEDVPLTVLYEDEHILAVDKPAGVLIHPSRSRNCGTLANAVAGYYRRTGQSSAFHPVTRLDRDTFGVVLLGKHSHAHALLSGLHEAGELTKIYEAAVFGCPEADEGIIDAPIARRPLPSLLRYVNQDGKPSQTRYELIRREADFSILRLWPLTGRTHQLRLHCAHIGCPILGDPQYGNPESEAFSEDKGLQYQLLCARQVEFVHPMTKKTITITSRMDALHPLGAKEETLWD